MRTTERAPERTAAPFGNPPVGQQLGIPFMAAFYHWSVGSWRRRFVIARRIPKTRMYAYLRIPCIFARARLTSRRLEAERPKGTRRPFATPTLACDGAAVRVGIVAELPQARAKRTSRIH